MIFVDANVFLRYLVHPATAQHQVHEQRAADSFARVEEGHLEMTTSEATLAEVAFITSDRRHYGVPRDTSAPLLKALLIPPLCRLRAKDVCLRALDVWVEQPKPSFPDALAAAYSELRGHELATFDARLAQTPRVTRYPPFG